MVSPIDIVSSLIHLLVTLFLSSDVMTIVINLIISNLLPSQYIFIIGSFVSHYCFYTPSLAQKTLDLNN